MFHQRLHWLVEGDYGDWSSASCIVMARAFNTLGAIHLHFVPFQNYPPVGADPDVYLHWPPLYPLVLAFFLRTLGDTPASGRILALLLQLGTGALVAVLARRLISSRGAALAVFLFFTMPATFMCATAIIQQPLAIFLALLSFACFAIDATTDRERQSAWLPILSCAAIALSVASAWDTIFMPFGFLASALVLRHRRAIRAAIAACIAAVTTFIAVQLDYLLTYPKLFADQFSTVLFRMGAHFNTKSAIHLNVIVDASTYSSQDGVLKTLWRGLGKANGVLPTVSLIACLIFIALWVHRGQRDDSTRVASSPQATLLILGWIAPSVLWFLVMRNYAAIHDFPYFLAAPAVAIVSAAVLDSLWTWARLPALRWALMIGTPFILFIPQITYWRLYAVIPPVPAYKDFDALMRRTPTDAIILTPTQTPTVVLYGERHVVRGINSDVWLATAKQEARNAFPGSPIYLEVLDKDAHDFNNSLEHLTAVDQQGDSTLYRIP